MNYSIDRWKKLAGISSSENIEEPKTLTEGIRNLGMANPGIMGNPFDKQSKIEEGDNALFINEKLNEQTSSGVVFVVIGEGAFGDPERFDGVYSSLENAQSAIREWQKEQPDGFWLVQANKLDSPDHGEIVWTSKSSEDE